MHNQNIRARSFVQFLSHSCFFRCAHKYPDGSYCATTFTTEAGLTKHIRDIHEREEQGNLLQCLKCKGDEPRLFHSKAALKTHNKEHHQVPDDVEGMYSCNYTCYLGSFVHIFSIRAFSDLHKCPHCSKGFRVKRYLADHLEICPKRKDLVWYDCDLCLDEMKSRKATRKRDRPFQTSTTATKYMKRYIRAIYLHSCQ